MDFPYKNALLNLDIGIYILDSNRKIIFWNHAAEKISGYSAEDAIGHNCVDRLLRHHNFSGIEPLCKTEKCGVTIAMLTGERHTDEFFIVKREGMMIPVVSSTTPVFDEKGSIAGVVCYFYDNTSSLRLKEELESLEKKSLLDTVTGVGNRRYAEIQLNTVMEKYRRYGWEFGILFIDIDHFKNVNDRYGHNFGDRILKTVATLLKYSLRTTDFLGRWGGEEFIGIICNAEETTLLQIAERARRFVGQNVLKHNGEDVSVTISVGATAVLHDDTVETIVERADNFMYKSKQGGRNRITAQMKVITGSGPHDLIET
ncbi:diguanylate cyclase [Myxococcota bacterium]|nr:diguanylate cyclase [Myxococcota bacterium]MBU1379736.1 diguanylate cyclase [Myxococcota bacterium]MBU1496880.1 diguanylate cyclase [Myxococcota bacterium]